MKNPIHPSMPGRMKRYLPPVAFALAALMLSGCGGMRSSVVFEPSAGGATARDQQVAGIAPSARTPVPGGSYEVRQGDTLYSIAFRNGVDFRDLAQWNAIQSPYTIWPGQRLTLSPASGSASASHAAAVARVAATSSAGTSGASTVSPQAAPSAPVFEPVVPAKASAAVPATASATAQTPTPPAPATTAPVVVPVAGVPVQAPATLPPPTAPIAGSSRTIGGVNWRWPATGAILKRFKATDAIPGIEIGGNPGDPVRAAADGVVVYSGNGLVGYGELVIVKHSDSFLSAYGHNRKRLVKEGQRVTAGQQVAELGSSGASRNQLQFQIRKDGNPVDPLGYLPPR